ncbi:MAG TPA: hypothetical protein PLL82_08930, partial [Candidatus Aminicenantes bacterium]|nr:hypothetical protein [Candidatus Aminicenantes bacterium]HQF98684.1 hypothetical protein [Candidatus Aminicenantes bacterium]HQH46414.1 hypothetical protein [Candidatus Aminicenantes bacterium]HQJ43380.1 hypothetical protein [Candidatus Aminicenantes bacterium]
IFPLFYLECCFIYAALYKYCDDCLSKELNITPRQQVNQICNKFAKAGKIMRNNSICDNCGKQKLSNHIGVEFPFGQKAYVLKESIPLSKEIFGNLEEFDIEKIRTQVVHICHKIWIEKKEDAAPHSISSVINILKNDHYLPDHQANMMLTLCSMRNECVYDDFKLGDREKAIAINAWKIISDWWGNKK